MKIIEQVDANGIPHKYLAEEILEITDTRIILADGRWMAIKVQNEPSKEEPKNE